MSRHFEVLSNCRSFRSGLPTTPSREIIGGHAGCKTPASRLQQEVAPSDAYFNPAVLHACLPAETPLVAPDVPHDTTTKAALAYFEAEDNIQLKQAFGDLLAIVLKAKGNLFLTELGMRSSEETEAFLRAWLIEKLCRTGDAHEAARTGKFRYLGNQGRNALIDEIRKRTRSEDVLLRTATIVPFEPSIDDDDDDYHFWPDNLLGTDRRQGMASTIGKKPALEPLALQELLRESQDQLTMLLGKPLFSLLSTICGLFPDNLAAGEVTRAIAKSNGVSEQTARKLHHKLAASLRMVKDHASIRALAGIISSSGDPILLSTSSWEPLCQSG